MEGGINGTNSTFYKNSNESNSSVSQYSQYSQPIGPSSQVYSVGFNNLKKIDSNTSQLSTTSVSTLKNNPLTRFFTKNRSFTNSTQIQNQILESSNNSDENEVSASELKKTSSTNLKLQKKNKLKLGSKNSSKPDLSIQTSGHHSIRVPKKILSSTSLDEPRLPRKNSVSSPVSTLYNFFHRTQSFSQTLPDNQSLSNIKDEILSPQKTNANPTRTVITLSSNSSNSYLTDPKFAIVYNFTNPDFTAEEHEFSTDHNSLHDIHKILMTPTDQYFQTKIRRSQTMDFAVSKFDGADNEYSNTYLSDFHKNNAKFFQSLLEITKSLFLPSHYARLSNGTIHTQMGISLEDLSNYIKETYVNGDGTNDKSNNSKALRSKVKLPKQNITKSSSSLSLNDGMNVNQTDFKIRELSHDLLTYFTRCMILLKNNFIKANLQTFNQFSIDYDGYSPLAISLIKSWQNLGSIWLFFNLKIRYFLLGAFQPFQNYFDELATQIFPSDLDHNSKIEIESILLVAFRDVIILPILFERESQGNSIIKPDSIIALKQNSVKESSPSLSQKSSTLTLQEENALKLDDSKLLKVISNCFGTIITHTSTDIGNSDGQQHFRDEIFINTFNWLSDLY